MFQTKEIIHIFIGNKLSVIGDGNFYLIVNGNLYIKTLKVYVNKYKTTAEI